MCFQVQCIGLYLYNDRPGLLKPLCCLSLWKHLKITWSNSAQMLSNPKYHPLGNVLSFWSEELVLLVKADMYLHWQTGITIDGINRTLIEEC